MRDLRYAWRMLLKNPGSSAVIVLSLAIGIGANSALFSVVNGLLLRPLPYPHPERLVAIWLHSPGIGILRDWPSPGQFTDLRTQNRSFQEMALTQSRTVTLTGRGEPVRVNVLKTTSNLMRMLGAQTAAGRLLISEDDAPGKTQVAILSYGSWTRLFNGDARILGQTITLNGQPFTVAGVLGRDFMLNAEIMPSEGPMDKLDIFLPLPLTAELTARRGDENYNILAVLKPGVSVEQAQADVDVIAARIRDKDKRDRTFGMTVVGLLEQVVGDIRRTLLVLLGSVTLVLLIACVNVANLLLTRAAQREKEVAIRTALGAGGRRLIRQLLTESLLLALAGGLAGLAIAQACLYLVRAINPGNIPRLQDVRIDATVLAFTFATSAVTGVLFGIAPAWRAGKVDLITSLKAGGRSGQIDGGLSLMRNRLRGMLVVSELALAVMLLVGAALLVRSYNRLQHVSPGFNPNRVLAASVALSGPRYRNNDAAQMQFYKEVGDRIARLPGVKNHGAVSPLPLTGEVSWGGIKVEGFTPAPGQELQVDLRTASTGYFETMEIPLVAGRFFSPHDTPQSQQIVIVDAKFARNFWPGGDAVGKHVWFDPKKPFVIAGVVGNVKQYGLASDSKMVVYFPLEQQVDGGAHLVARTAGDPAALASAIVREVRAFDSNVPVYDVRTMDDRLYQSLSRERFSTALLGAFAGFALLLAAVGVYGVISRLVAQATHDIGVRMALGAQPRGIVGLVVRQGMGLASIGIILGLAGAAALTGVMRSLLFGVGARDALSYAGAVTILALVALAACSAPALRASRVDPMKALREE